MKVLIGLLSLVVVAAGVILALPFLIDLNEYQSQYKPLIEDALNRNVQLKDIRLTLWPRIGARVAGFVVLEDQAFGGDPFASLTSLDVGVKLMPLLGGKVEVEDITLRDPVITVIRNKNGVLNISTLGRTGVALPQAPSRAPIPSTEGPLKILALLAVDRVSIAGGTVTYRDLSAAEPVEYVLQDLQFMLKSVHLGQSPSLHFAAQVHPFNLPVMLDGTFGPLKETTDIDAMHLQMALGKTIFTITGNIAGRDAKVNISSPVLNTAHLPVALPLKKSVELKNFELAAVVKGQDLLLSNLSFQLFDGRVKGQGSLTSGSNSPLFMAQAMIQDVRLGPALNAVVATQLSVSGTVGGDLTLQGHGFSIQDLTKTLEGTSHVAVKDGTIEGVDLLREAISLLKVANISPDDPKTTVFSTIETDLAISQGIISVQRFLMDSHDFLATGNGTIGFDQTLNLNVTISLSQALSQTIISSSPVARRALTDGRLTVPLLITGTLQLPVYALDSKALAGRVQEQVMEKVKGAIDDLLKGSPKLDDLKQKGKDLLKGLLRR